MATLFPATVVSALCLSLMAGCSHSASPPVAPTGGQAASAVTAAPSVAKPSTDETRGTIAISDEIRKACGISDEDAYFAFDSARIDGRARGVLSQVTKCFKSGPLAGRQLNLVGRADPRGDNEYNMVLGGHRASAVGSTLEDLGLARDRISSSSRGAMDARGTDEATWAKDRRVDVLLGSS